MSRDLLAWDRPNGPESITTETSIHGRQSGGVVVEMGGRNLLAVKVSIALALAAQHELEMAYLCVRRQRRQ